MTQDARAGDSLVVVELYTSQGCSSCPPADAMVADLAKRDDVLPLALHVDYWDYIGWPDHFADPAFVTRQQVYAQIAGSRTIYTPQMVVAGQDHVIGARSAELGQIIAGHANRRAPVIAELTRQGGQLSVSARINPVPAAPVSVVLVRYIPSETVSIGRGENAGRTIEYVNIVTQMREVARWADGAPLSLNLPLDGDYETAVLFQIEGQGPILAAFRPN